MATLCRRLAAGLSLTLLVACGGPRSTHPPPPPIHAHFYRVRPGDTLYSIARRSGRDYHDLARWNGIRPPYLIHVGQVLRLVPRKPAARPHGKRRPAVSRKKVKKVLKHRWRWPLKGVIVRNFAATGRKGIDIAAPLGTPVRAAAAGKVVYSGSGLVGYGKLVIVKHGETYLSAYGNNRRLHVREGQWVKAGQVIGEVGRGSDRGTVLHFEIRRNGEPVDPLRMLPKR